MSSGLLPDWMIRRDVIITPFAECEKRPGVISYGLSSYGYDVRLGENFKILEGSGGTLDPKEHSDQLFTSVGFTKAVFVPPHGFVLAETLEYIKIPDDVLGVCVGKSTYARCGLVVNTTPLEPGWRGKVTLELSNTTPLPIKVYVGEGIAQVLFYRGAGKCEMNYATKQGKYQDQTGVTLPKVD
jgi:dCTP deaminase